MCRDFVPPETNPVHDTFPRTNTKAFCYSSKNNFAIKKIDSSNLEF